MLKTLCLLLCLAAPLPATTILFPIVPARQTASLNIGGVTVTGGPGLVNVSSAGLGVVGGGHDDSIDRNDALTFTFNGASANNVLLLTTPNIVPSVSVSLLGGGTVSAFGLNVSAIAGFQPITGFQVFGVNSAPFALNRLDFDITAPEPSSLAMVITALAVLALGRRRQKIATGNSPM